MLLALCDCISFSPDDSKSISKSKLFFGMIQCVNERKDLGNGGAASETVVRCVGAARCRCRVGAEVKYENLLTLINLIRFIPKLTKFSL